MDHSFGAWLSSIASVVLIGLLLAAFVGESRGDVMLYYGFDTINPLFAGIFAIGVVLSFAGVSSGRLSESTGIGVALGLAVGCLIVVTAWALTGRVDVFLAPGWAFPVHRWVLVAVALIVVLGVALRAWKLGLFRPQR